MRIPPRAKKSQEVIDQMVNWLGYYMGQSKEFKEFVKSDIKYLEEYLSEISEDHKLHNIKLATKLKARWKQDLKKEIKKLGVIE